MNEQSQQPLSQYYEDKDDLPFDNSQMAYDQLDDSQEFSQENYQQPEVEYDADGNEIYPQYYDEEGEDEQFQENEDEYGNTHEAQHEYSSAEGENSSEGQQHEENSRFKNGSSNRAHQPFPGISQQSFQINNPVSQNPLGEKCGENNSQRNGGLEDSIFDRSNVNEAISASHTIGDSFGPRERAPSVNITERISAPSFGAHTNAEFEQQALPSNRRSDLNGKSDHDYTENTYNATDFFGERGTEFMNPNYEQNSEELGQNQSGEEVQGEDGQQPEEERDEDSAKDGEVDYAGWESSEPILSSQGSVDGSQQSEKDDRKQEISAFEERDNQYDREEAFDQTQMDDTSELPVCDFIEDSMPPNVEEQIEKAEIIKESIHLIRVLNHKEIESPTDEKKNLIFRCKFSYKSQFEDNSD